MTSSPGLGDDLGHLVNLSLCTAEGTKLSLVSVLRIKQKGVMSYSSLRELSGALVLAVTEEFDDTALVWGEAVP